ncbi:MAG: response regulator transcription factor [Wenzhouxiangella sp.]
MASNILIADDEANLLVSLEYLMRHHGFDVSVARSGDEALALIRQQPPDLVIVDVMLPGQSGFEVCQQIRSDPALQDIPVIMLSARARETDIAKGKALGASAFIVKPFAVADLLEQVRAQLGTHQ